MTERPRLCPHCKRPLTYSKGFELWLCRKCDLAPLPARAEGERMTAWLFLAAVVLFYVLALLWIWGLGRAAALGDRIVIEPPKEDET